jgi:transcriptional regulator of arginine metabolism
MYLYTMKTKKERLLVIKRLITSRKLSNQEELLEALRAAGFELTQATLSRDLKEIKVGKMHDPEKGHIYVLLHQLTASERKPQAPTLPAESVVNLSFSYNLGILKTLPGFASSIAIYIDNCNVLEIAGTIAGDDTILLILNESFDRRQILNALEDILPGIEEKTV